MVEGQASELVVEFVAGSQASVGFCRVGPETNFEGMDYLASLASSDQKKFEARFVRLAELGSLVNAEHFNYEGSGIWFLKIDGHRLACFKHAGRWLMITSGAKKDPKDRTREGQTWKRRNMTTDPMLEQEHLILDVTEMIVELMNERGVSRSELADRLGKTKGHVSQLLSGSRNLTLRTLSDIFVALDFRFLPTAMPLAEPYAGYLRSRPENGLRFFTPRTRKSASQETQRDLADSA